MLVEDEKTPNVVKFNGIRQNKFGLNNNEALRFNSKLEIIKENIQMEQESDNQNKQDVKTDDFQSIEEIEKAENSDPKLENKDIIMGQFNPTHLETYSYKKSEPQSKSLKTNNTNSENKNSSINAKQMNREENKREATRRSFDGVIYKQTSNKSDHENAFSKRASHCSVQPITIRKDWKVARMFFLVSILNKFHFISIFFPIQIIEFKR